MIDRSIPILHHNLSTNTRPNAKIKFHTTKSKYTFLDLCFSAYCSFPMA